MLDGDYSRLLAELTSAIPCRVELPESQADFFELKGVAPTRFDEMRSSMRTRVRVLGLMMPLRSPPASQTPAEPTVIYTKDFGKTDCGFVCHRQLYPAETVRLLLATFWMDVEIRSCRKSASHFFETGASLVCQGKPSMTALEPLAGWLNRHSSAVSS